MAAPTSTPVPAIELAEFLHCCELTAREGVTAGGSRGRSGEPPTPDNAIFVEAPVTLRMVAVRERCGADHERFMAIAVRYLAVMDMRWVLSAHGYLREVDGGLQVDRVVFEAAATEPIGFGTSLQFHMPSFLKRVAAIQANAHR